VADHDLAPQRAGARYRKNLAIALILVLGFLVVEVVAAFTTDSLALLSDAGHMGTDALGLAMALAAIVAADRARDRSQRTYGLYRLEILAALANAVLLFLVGAYVLIEAARRLTDPQPVMEIGVIVVGSLGLVVNLVAWALLRRGATESVNVEGAYLEVLADLLGSVGVLIAATIQLVTGWPYADPIFAAIIGGFVLPRAFRLGRRALRILLQSAPDHIDVAEMESRLATLPGVVDVHDLHVWTLTSDMDVVTAHLMVRDDVDTHAVLDSGRHLLQSDFAVAHATLQVEPESHRGCTDVSW
jgi:cobalt-zinc-cadmium efflux system protein